MIQIEEHPQARGTYRPRTHVELAAQQLAAIHQFHQERQAADAAADASLSREERLDSDRQRDVMRREHAAIVSQCDQELRLSGQVLPGRAVRRVVIAHRSDWFVDRIASVLAEQGIHVVARLDNGADAVGTVIAEQPDVLLVEDSLAMVAGEQVIRAVQNFSPDTAVVAQAAYSDRVGALLEAGAAAVFTRQIPPADVVRSLVQLLSVDPA